MPFKGSSDLGIERSFVDLILFAADFRNETAQPFNGTVLAAAETAVALGVQFCLTAEQMAALFVDRHHSALALDTGNLALGNGAAFVNHYIEPDALIPELQTIARQAAKALTIRLQEGVYMYFPGPQFETPAEIRAARVLGADAVGMSTVPEAIIAAHCGMKVLGFTLCTNMAAGVLDQPLSGEEVIEAGKAAAPRFAALVKACLQQA